MGKKVIIKDIFLGQEGKPFTEVTNENFKALNEGLYDVSSDIRDVDYRVGLTNKKVLSIGQDMSNKVDRDEIKDFQAGILFQAIEVEKPSDLPIPPNKFPSGETPLNLWGVYVKSEGCYYQYNESTKKWNKTPFKEIPRDVATNKDVQFTQTQLDGLVHYGELVQGRIDNTGQLVIEANRVTTKVMKMPDNFKYKFFKLTLNNGYKLAIRTGLTATNLGDLRTWYRNGDTILIRPYDTFYAVYIAKENDALNILPTEVIGLELNCFIDTSSKLSIERNSMLGLADKAFITGGDNTNYKNYEFPFKKGFTYNITLKGLTYPTELYLKTASDETNVMLSKISDGSYKLSPSVDCDYIRFRGGNVECSIMPESNILDVVDTIRPFFNKVVNYTWEQGTFNGGLDKVESMNRVRTVITVPLGVNCCFLLKPGYTITVFNLKPDGTVESTPFNDPNLIIPRSNRLYISLGKKTGENISVSEISDQVTFYVKSLHRNNPKYTMTLAASNSTSDDKLNADVVCDGTNDQLWLQLAINSSDNPSTNVLLLDGTYYMSYLNQDDYGHKYCLNSTLTKWNIRKVLNLDGTSKAPNHNNKHSATITFTPDFWNALDVDEEISILSAYGTQSIGFTTHVLNMSNIGFVGLNYNKNIVYVDGYFFSALNAEYVGVRQYNTLQPPVFSMFPKGIGIRGLQGSNNGTGSKLTSCRVMYCGKGFDLGGEHWLLQDCLAHHCEWGFAFGDYMCTIQLEHPNMMVGCSIEQCFNAMRLGRYGVNSLDELPANAVWEQTIVAIGTSTEAWFETKGMSSLGYEDGIHAMKGVTETIPNTWRGTIEFEKMGSKLFEKNGNQIKGRLYVDRISGSKEHMYHAKFPTLMQQYFCTDDNKWYTYNGTEWV